MRRHALEVAMPDDRRRGTAQIATIEIAVGIGRRDLAMDDDPRPHRDDADAADLHLVLVGFVVNDKGVL